MSIVVFDGRTASPTFGAINEFKVSDRNPTLLVIPPDLYHGWKNIGTSEAFVINMPTVQYDYENPDALDLPYDAPAAAEIVPPLRVTLGAFIVTPDAIASVAPLATVTALDATALGLATSSVPAETVVEPE